MDTTIEIGMNLNNNIKICGVCGDKALGYNFNALTCESCKAFFRRNALRNKKFSCISGNKCKLDPKTRKYCRKCRLDKCLEIGMKKEWILTDEEKLTKRRKHRHIETKDADSSTSAFISANRTKMAEIDNINYDSSNTEKFDVPASTTKTKNNIIILPIFPNNNNNNNNNINSFDSNRTSEEFVKSLDPKRLIEIVNEKLSLSLPGTMVDEDSSINNIIVYNDVQLKSLTETREKQEDPALFQPVDHPSTIPLLPHSASYPEGSLNQPSVTVENYGSYPSMSSDLLNPAQSVSLYDMDDGGQEKQDKVPQDIYEHALRIQMMTEHMRMNSDFKHLNRIERDRLEELRRVFQPLYAEENNQVKHLKMITSHEEGFECLENTIKQLIIVVKNIKSFKNLCDHDQLSLMKGSIGKVKGLLNIRYFNAAQEHITIPNPQQKNAYLVINHECLRKSYGDRLYDRCKKFALSFRDDWKDDDSIMNLLMVIMMFWPNRPDLLHPEYIKLEYLSYCHLLQRYLEIKYQSVCEAKSVYMILLSLLKELNLFTEESMEFILMKFDPKYIGKLTYAVYDLDRKFKHS